MFMDRVCPVPYATHSVERRDADACSEISVGAATDGSLVELPVNLLCDCLRLIVESGNARVAFHRQPIDAAFDAQPAMLIEGFKGAEFAIENGGLPREFDAHIN